MTNKQILQNKVSHLESLLLESSLVQEGLAKQLENMQAKIDSYKESNNPKDLEQNNELIMQLIQTRLDLGKQTYHQNVPIMPRDDITRDNFYEAVQEALDLSVYLSAYMLRLMEEKERREGETTTADEYNKSITMEEAVNFGPPYSTGHANALDERKAKNDKTKESTT
jgi:cobalamin biosynthesis Mg chelatase CobN